MHIHSRILNMQIPAEEKLILAAYAAGVCSPETIARTVGLSEEMVKSGLKTHSRILENMGYAREVEMMLDFWGRDNFPPIIKHTQHSKALTDLCAEYGAEDVAKIVKIVVTHKHDELAWLYNRGPVGLLGKLKTGQTVVEFVAKYTHTRQELDDGKYLNNTINRNRARIQRAFSSSQSVARAERGDQQRTLPAVSRIQGEV